VVRRDVEDVCSVGEKASFSLAKKGNHNLLLARRIRAAGRPIYIPGDDGGTSEGPSNSLDVYQIGGQLESSAFEYSAGTGITIQLVITVLAPTFVIANFDVELPWQKIGFRWLDDPLEIDESLTKYSFSGRYHEFERKQVLNHRADVCRTLRRGQSIKGFLLGNDMAPIPDEVRDASLFPATVIIGDQYSRRYRAPVELTAMRGEKYVRRPSRRGGLFDKRDRILLDKARYDLAPEKLKAKPAILVNKVSARSTLTDKDIMDALEEVTRKKYPREVPVLS
jgi:hypothetical protein